MMAQLTKKRMSQIERIRSDCLKISIQFRQYHE